MRLFLLLAITNGAAVLLTAGCVIALYVLHGPRWVILSLACAVVLQVCVVRASVRAALLWRRTRHPGGRR